MDNTASKGQSKSQSTSVKIAVFLRNPKHSKKYKLNVYHREILRVIANYLDMPYGSCFAKQIVLAQECGMSEEEFRRKSKELIELKLLQRTKCHKLYHYNLSTLTGLLDR